MLPCFLKAKQFYLEKEEKHLTAAATTTKTEQPMVFVYKSTFIGVWGVDSVQNEKGWHQASSADKQAHLPPRGGQRDVFPHLARQP